MGADVRSGPLFRYLKARRHGNRFCEKMANSALSSLWHSETEWDNATNATISCKMLVKISPVVSAENSLMEIALRVHVVVRRILSNISGCTKPIFAIFSPYESTLRADDGSCTLFSNLSRDVAMATK